MRKVSAWLTALVTGSAMGLGCGSKSTGIETGSEAILYSPNFQEIGVTTAGSDRLNLPVGTRVMILDLAVRDIPGFGKLSDNFPDMARVSIKEGPNSGTVGFVEQAHLKPLP